GSQRRGVHREPGGEPYLGNQSGRRRGADPRRTTLKERPTMGSSGPIDPEAVRALAVHAGLPLAPGREAMVAPVLNAWLADANALSRKMSAPEHWTLAPVTIFSQPAVEDGEA